LLKPAFVIARSGECAAFTLAKRRSDPEQAVAAFVWIASLPLSNDGRMTRSPIIAF
jgi:hypothetical protein